MTHYVCAGCKGVSDHEGVCQTPDCPMLGQPLDPCDCVDKQHGGPILGDGEEEED